MSSTEILTCANCGGEEPAGSRFCGSCGSPFVPADPQSAPTASLEAPTTPGVTARASTDAPTEVAPPPAGPKPPTPAAAGASARTRRPVRLLVLIVALLLLVVGGATAVLFGTGVIGANSVKSDSAFALQVNENALGPLGQADETAAGNARTSNGALTRAADGADIVRAADAASMYLLGLSGLSAQQQDQVRLLLAFVSANRLYGQAFAAFAPGDSETQLALDRAAAAARASIASTQSGMSADLQLPSETAFISLRSPSPPPPSSTTTTAPAPADLAAVYVQQVDHLLRQSHAVVLSLRAFVPRAANDAISRSEAVARARSYVDTRSLELAEAQALTVPPSFALANQLLIRSLQVSLADDQALVTWTVARRDSSGNAKAALAEVNRIGAQASALKRQFLRVYGQQRQAATGRSPATLPDVF